MEKKSQSWPGDRLGRGSINRFTREETEGDAESYCSTCVEFDVPLKMFMATRDKNEHET